MPETCQNCEKTIGNLETAMVFEDKLVCQRCHTDLSLAKAQRIVEASRQPGSIHYAPQPMPAPPMMPQPIYVVAPSPRWSRGVAALLSFLLPGLGQMYKGQIFNGIAWFVCVVIGYFLFVIPGVILHILCVLGAASGNNMR